MVSLAATPTIALTAVERDIEAIEVTAALSQIEDGDCSPPNHFLAGGRDNAVVEEIEMRAPASYHHSGEVRP